MNAIAYIRVPRPLSTVAWRTPLSIRVVAIIVTAERNKQVPEPEMRKMPEIYG